ncbi:hypothetical protein [Nakamurella multipartita]|nr:hypothetical protein [Nakamurella multipartita]
MNAGRPAGGAQDLADTVRRHGSSGLRARREVPHNMLPFHRPIDP